MNDINRLAQLKRLASANAFDSDEARRTWADEISKAVAKSPTFVRELAQPLSVIRTQGLPEDLYLELGREIQSRIVGVIDLLESDILDFDGKSSAAAAIPSGDA